MRHLFIGLFILLAFLVGHLWAGELREIELDDGSVIFGEIVSLKDGVYTLVSKSLGTVRLEEGRIRAIRSKTPPVSPEIPLEEMKHRMMNDDEIMSMILTLQNDPDFKEILKDPVIMNAIASGDINALLSNQEFLKLLDNPTIKEIGKKVQK